jgi:hypothetical protein
MEFEMSADKSARERVHIAVLVSPSVAEALDRARARWEAKRGYYVRRLLVEHLRAEGHLSEGESK